MSELVHLSIADGVGTITLDSPHNRNALSTQLVRELAAAVDEVERSAARALVLRHEGPAFCAGADLKERSNASSGDTTASSGNPLVATMERLMDMPIPTIAAVEGAVRAGGIGLMASCDLVVVRSDVTFALTEVRIGVAAAIISVPILRRVSPGKIAAAMLTGEQFDTAEARDIGLITHTTDDVPGTVAALCDGVRAGAPNAVAETKRILRHVPTLGRDQAFAEMSELSARLFLGDEAREGMAAFKEKRRPSWPT